MLSFLQDLRLALRSLARSPVFALVSILTLGLGIGATCTVFSLVDGVLLRPFPFEQPDRLVAVHETDRKRGLDEMSLSYPDFVDWREQAETLDEMAAYEIRNFSLEVGDRPEQIEGAVVSANLFDALGIRPSPGRTFLSEEDAPGARPVAILSHRLWRDRFGSDPGVLERSVRIDGTPTTIVGIAPEEFAFPIQSDLWVPLALDVTSQARNRHFLSAVGRLAPGESVESARTELVGIARQLQQAYPETNENTGAVILPLRDYFVSNARPVFIILLVAVMFVLLIACANVANMLLARAISRQRELAVRTALGAGRLQVMRQLLAESMVLAVAGAALGVGFAHLGIQAIMASVPAELPYWIEVGVDGRVLLFSAAMAFLTVLLVGLLPALRASRVDVNQTLKEGGGASSSSAGRQRLSNALVIAEVALSLILLICAGLMIQSFLRVQTVDPGFDPDSMLTLRVGELPSDSYPELAQVSSFYDRLLERVEALPGVVRAGAGAQIPLESRGGREVFFSLREVPESLAGEVTPVANQHIVSPGYFEALDVPILEGRGFDSRESAGEAGKSVVINRAMARRFWRDASALGQQLQLGTSGSGDWWTIVGVVGDVHQRSLGSTPKIDIYFPHTQRTARSMGLMIRTQTDPDDLTPAVRSALAGLDGDLPIYQVATMDQVIERSLAFELFGTRMIFVFGAIALLLAAVALYGLIAYSTSQRTVEIGVRMALGAEVKDVIWLVLKKGVKLAAIGLVIGLPLAVGLNVLLSSVLYGVGSVEIGIVVAIVVTLVLVALIASYVPARRASRVPPTLSLRQG
jgi:putative ABC transport system permease protein